MAAPFRLHFMKLHTLFSDHAVLQQGKPIPVWGTTRPNLTVTAELAGQSASTIASASGAFILRLPPLPAGGPHELVVTTGDSEASIRIHDILIGEVWICSGQSNMEFAVSASAPDPEPADCEGIRMITVPRLAEMGRQHDFDGQWIPATRAHIHAFSAVGYFFARRLHENLNVPVGMIHTSWGGTRVEAWTSRESLVESPLTAQQVHAYEADLADPAYWEQTASIVEFPVDPGNTAEAKGWASPEHDEADWGSASIPGSFSACRPPATNGAFWYRKTITLPADWIGRPLTLHLGAADKHDVTYFNGHCVGATGSGLDQQYWCQNRIYAVPATANTRAEATIAVRVWSFIFDGGLIGPAHEMRLECPGSDTPPIPLCGPCRYRIEHDIGLTPPPPPPPFLPGNPNAPYTLFDSMIHPLLPVAMRGAIWYQGESNASEARAYFDAHCNLIRDWRHAWGQGEFPFICVQLANFRPPMAYEAESTWAVLREAQLLTTRALPNVGMAVAIDIGDAADIHPRNKRDVGRRLAQWALARVYNRPLPATGPHYAAHTLEGRAIRIHFTDVGGGLVVRDPRSKIRTCMIAGSDRVFRPADATIDGETLLVHAPEVPAPKAVRYAWADNPDGCNLYNAEGLPASPFRTDCWPVLNPQP